MANNIKTTNQEVHAEDSYYAIASKFLAEPSSAHYWWGIGLIFFSCAVFSTILLVYGFGIQQFFLETGLRPANYKAIGALVMGLSGLLCIPLSFGGMLLLKYGLIAKRLQSK